HIDVPLAAFLAGSDVLHIGDSARLDLQEPQPPARDGADELVAGVGTDRTKVAALTLVRDKDLAVSRGGALGPRNREDDLLCPVMLAIGICRSEIPVITSPCASGTAKSSVGSGEDLGIGSTVSVIAVGVTS